MGLFKKLAIADHLSLYVDPVFADPAGHCSRAVWLATLAYPLQVYCDFSGYSDMALGFAHMLGYKLARNFNLPFLAVNIADFWRRWHISLSTWLRDYLFIPLGGSRSARWKIGCNLLVTMTLAGLWHGANWPFVVFGFLQGLLLLGHRWFREFCARRPRLQVLLQTAAGTILRMGLTFTSFALALIVFRAPTLSAASTIYHRMMVPHEGQLSPLTAHSLLTIGLLVAVCHAPPRSSSGLGGSCGCRARWWACVMPSPCRWL
jgi:alginate O-acetyltransferase complex protein AlgI